MSLPEIEEERLSPREAEPSAPIRDAEAGAPERVHSTLGPDQGCRVELGGRRRQRGLAGGRGRDESLVRAAQDEPSELEESPEVVQDPVDRCARREARGGAREDLQFSARLADLLGRTDAALPEGGRDQAARGESEERSHVARLVDLEGEIRLRQKE